MTRDISVLCEKPYLEHAWYGALTVRQTLSPEEVPWLRNLIEQREPMTWGFQQVDIPVRRDSDERSGRIRLADDQPIRAGW